jgi:hypothetical protein
MSLEEILKKSFAPFVMCSAAFADASFTYLNIGTYGIGVEANPVVKNLMEYTSITAGLAIPKLCSIAIISYIADKMNHLAGTSLMYGAGIVWGVGAAMNGYMIMS